MAYRQMSTCNCGGERPGLGCTHPEKALLFLVVLKKVVGLHSGPRSRAQHKVQALQRG